MATAVTAYENALKIYGYAEHSVDRALTRQNLAGALAAQGERIQGTEGAKLLAKAAIFCKQALKVRTFYDYPVGWARTTHNLADVFRMQGVQASGHLQVDLLVKATTNYDKANEILTQNDHPIDWAKTKKNLALVEVVRAESDYCTDPRDHLQAALVHVTGALEVFDPEHMVYEHKQSSRLRDDIEAKLAALDMGE